MEPQPRPVRESLREPNDGSWIIGGRLLLSRQSFEAAGCTWSDGDGSYVHLSEVSEPPPPSRSLRPTSPFSLVDDAGDAHVVWKVGDAFLKVMILTSPRATREHVVLNALHTMELSFNIPDVLYHGEWDGRYYLVLSQVPGQTLSEAWPHMDDIAKDECVCRVTEICKELAMKHGDRICGIDGNHLPEPYLIKSDAELDFSPEALLENCQKLGMIALPSCSTISIWAQSTLWWTS